MKVLAYTSPARGHLFPLVPILDELSSRGHDIALRTLASEVGLMRERGFAAAPVSPALEAMEHDDYEARTPAGAIKRGMGKFAERAPAEVPDLRAAIAEESPDALIVDTNCWGASAAAEASGLPWAQFHPWPLPVRSRDVPPFGPGLTPAAGPLGRARDRALRPLLEGPVKKVAFPGVNRVRTGLGLEPIDSLDRVFAPAPLVLYMSAEPFEYPRSDWPASVKLIGPSSWEPPAEAPAWLGQIDKPIVLVTTSSEFQDDGKLIATALEALEAEDVQVIATAPAASVEGVRVPANARIETFLPHKPVLERAAVAVTHGGAGATQKALGLGVPVCVVPFGRDQAEVARRAVVSGAGTRLPASKLSAGRLRDAVLGAMEKKAGAERVAEGFRTAGGAPAAADSLESLVGAPQLRRSTTMASP